MPVAPDTFVDSLLYGDVLKTLRSGLRGFASAKSNRTFRRRRHKIGITSPLLGNDCSSLPKPNVVVKLRESRFRHEYVLSAK